MDTVRIHGPAGTYEAPIHEASIGARILQGIGVSLALTLLRALALHGLRGLHVLDIAILFGAVAIAGAVGGACYYWTDWWRVRKGWRRTVANVSTILVFGLVAVAAILIMLGDRAWE